MVRCIADSCQRSLVFRFSLLFGNMYIYFEFKGEVIITSQTRTTVFLVLSAVCAGGTLLLLILRSNLPVVSDDTVESNVQT